MRKKYLVPRTEVLALDMEGDILTNSFIDVGGGTDKPFDSSHRREDDGWSSSSWDVQENENEY